jgi:hypothetical protein
MGSGESAHRSTRTKSLKRSGARVDAGVPECVRLVCRSGVAPRSFSVPPVDRASATGHLALSEARRNRTERFLTAFGMTQ